MGLVKQEKQENSKAQLVFCSDSMMGTLGQAIKKKDHQDNPVMASEKLT